MLRQINENFFGKFGYNEYTLKCDFIIKGDNHFNVRMMFFVVEALVPTFLIVICYLAIIYQIYSSSKIAASFG